MRFKHAKINKIADYIYYITAFMLILPGLCLSAPNIISLNGDSVVADGNVISVNGSGFGNVRRADYWDVFDDYNSDYEKDATGTGTAQSWPSTSSTWSDDGGWSQRFFSADTGTYGEPHLRLDSTNTNFSTGRAFTRACEYKGTRDGGALPNSGIAFIGINKTNEIYGIYYFKYDKSWDYPYTTVHVEKHFEIFLSNGNKMTVVLDTNAHQTGASFSPANARFFPVCGEIGGNSTTIDPPTADGAFPPPGKWAEMKFHFKLNSLGNTDGVCEMWLNGKKFINDNTVNFRGTNNITFGGTSSSNTPHFFGNIQAGGIQVFTLPGQGNEWEQSLDDVWLWVSDQPSFDTQFPMIPIVYLSNSSSWNGGPSDKLNGDANFVRQKIGGVSENDAGFKSWSDTQISFETNLGGLNTNNPVFLYVTNWNGETNPSGFELADIVPGEETAQPSSGTDESVWDANTSMGDDNWKDSGLSYCARILIPGDHITKSGNTIKLGFQGRTSGDYTIQRVSIAERDNNGGYGDVVDGTWTKITFDKKGESYTGILSPNSWENYNVVVPAGTEKISNAIKFDIQPGTDYFVTFNIVTPSVWLDPPSDYIEMNVQGSDYALNSDWSGIDYSTRRDYHALSNVYITGSAANPTGNQ